MSGPGDSNPAPAPSLLHQREGQCNIDDSGKLVVGTGKVLGLNPSTRLWDEYIGNVGFFVPVLCSLRCRGDSDPFLHRNKEKDA